MSSSERINRIREDAGLEPLTEASVDIVLLHLDRLQEALIVQAGKLDFAISEANIQLAQIRLQQLELDALAMQVKKAKLDLNTFIARSSKSNLKIVNTKENI